MKSIPTAALDILLHLIPLDVYTEQIAACTAARLTPALNGDQTPLVMHPFQRVEKCCENKEVRIKEFYENSTILITGGTGFVGKVLIEKLLRAFNVRRIYLLIRVKDNIGVNQRLANLFQECIFDKIRSSNPEALKKVYPIYADFNAIDLDISDTERIMLQEEVEIVFNVVASVKFNEKLSDAIDINLLGTKKILDIVMEIRNLKSFVHISTLYANCNRKNIKERVYDPGLGYEKIVQMARILEQPELEKLQHCLLEDMPNTYTMTKRCSESLVNHKAFYLPAGIFRLPIVISTYKEPLAGWTDNLYGPTGLCTWSARGFVRSIYGCANKKANLFPVDYCVNAIVTSAWDISRRYIRRDNSQSDLPVYNYHFNANNLTWGKYMHLARKGFHEPFDKALWCFSFVIVPWKSLHRITTFFLHNIPGYIFDLIAMATGQKRIYSKGYKKMGKVIQMMSYFGVREWNFSNRNIEELDASLRPEERNYLEFNIKTIDWRWYFRNYLSGIRKYFYREKDDKMDKKKWSYKRLYFLHVLLKSLLQFAFFMSFFKFITKILRIREKISL